MTLLEKMNLANPISSKPRECVDECSIGPQLFATQLRISKYKCVAKRRMPFQRAAKKAGSQGRNKTDCGQVISMTGSDLFAN
jgi:hypothetical protein